jgi:hypothetical protein
MPSEGSSPAGASPGVAASPLALGGHGGSGVVRRAGSRQRNAFEERSAWATSSRPVLGVNTSLRTSGVGVAPAGNVRRTRCESAADRRLVASRKFEHEERFARRAPRGAGAAAVLPWAPVVRREQGARGRGGNTVWVGCFRRVRRTPSTPARCSAEMESGNPEWRGKEKRLFAVRGGRRARCHGSDQALQPVPGGARRPWPAPASRAATGMIATDPRAEHCPAEHRASRVRWWVRSVASAISRTERNVSRKRRWKRGGPAGPMVKAPQARSSGSGGCTAHLVGRCGWYWLALRHGLVQQSPAWSSHVQLSEGNGRRVVQAGSGSRRYERAYPVQPPGSAVPVLPTGRDGPAVEVVTRADTFPGGGGRSPALACRAAWLEPRAAHSDGPGPPDALAEEAVLGFAAGRVAHERADVHAFHDGARRSRWWRGRQGAIGTSRFLRVPDLAQGCTCWRWSRRSAASRTRRTRSTWYSAGGALPGWARGAGDRAGRGPLRPRRMEHRFIDIRERLEALVFFGPAEGSRG